MNTKNNFNVYNLIFGDNASGKTTFSRFFNNFKFEDIKFKVTIENESIFKLEEPHFKKILVFNSDFIEDHIYSNSEINISEGKIQEISTPEIKLIENEINKLNKIIESLSIKNNFILTKYESLYYEYQNKFRNIVNNKNLTNNKNIINFLDCDLEKKIDYIEELKNTKNKYNLIKKEKVYSSSKFKLNKEIAEETKWSLEEINKYQEKMAEIAKEVW